VVQLIKGQIWAFFAFDVGYEIRLERIPKLLAATPLEPLSHKKPTPNYLQYTRTPQVLKLGSLNLELLGISGQVQATLFDFGAISLVYRWSLEEQGGLSLEELPSLSQHLYHSKLEEQAKTQLQTLMKTLRPAIVRPEVSTLVEDYYLFVLDRLDQPLSAESLLEQCGPILAQTLRFDTQKLSTQQQKEALAKPISYYENDLVLVDWNAAIIYDQDYSDTATVLELINVELLEARYIDTELDQRIREYEGLLIKRPKWPIPLRRPYQKTLKELAQLRIDYALLAERVDNALKLIGDLYLARVHNAATKRFYLQEWEAAISRKLEIIGELYQLLNDRVETAQGQTLELVVIILILFEIIMGLMQLR
jgi:hypothetical protein